MALTVTELDPVLLLSATEVAVTVTLAPLAGAVKVAAASLDVAWGDTDPQAATLHVTLQVTPLLLLSLLTVAVTVVVWPWSIEGFAALTLNEIESGAAGVLLPPPPHPQSAKQVDPTKQSHAVETN